MFSTIVKSEVFFEVIETPKQILSSLFFGMHIGAALTWRAHGDALARRLCYASFAVRQLSESASIVTLRTPCISLFQRDLLYSLLTWGHSAIMTHIFGIQRTVIRVPDGRGYGENCRASFMMLGVLTLPSLYMYITVSQIHCIQ